MAKYGKIIRLLKFCPRCQRRLGRENFGVHKARFEGLSTYCKECTRVHWSEVRKHHRAPRRPLTDTAREKRKMRRRLLAKNPEVARRQAARMIVNLLVHHGWWKKQPCQICGATDRVEAHHPTYDDPLSIQWLCRADHSALHARERTAARSH